MPGWVSLDRNGFRMRPEHLPLCSQPASFWIGAGLVAELPFMLAALLLPEQYVRGVIDFAISSAAGLSCVLLAAVALFLLTAWLAHRLGFGE